MLSILLIFAAMAVWGALHSVLASLKARALSNRWLGKRLSEGIYRSINSKWPKTHAKGA